MCWSLRQTRGGSSALLLLSLILAFATISSIFIRTALSLLLFLVPALLLCSLALIGYLAANFLAPLVAILYSEIEDEEGIIIGYVSETPWSSFTTVGANTNLAIHGLVFVFICSGPWSDFLTRFGASWSDNDGAGATLGMFTGFAYAVLGLGFFLLLVQPVVRFIFKFQLQTKMQTLVRKPEETNTNNP